MGLGVGSGTHPASLVWEMMWLTAGYALNQRRSSVIVPFAIELLGSRGGDKIEGHCQHLTLGVGGRRTRGIGSRDGSVAGSLKFCPAVQYYATEMLVKTLTGVTAV